MRLLRRLRAALRSRRLDREMAEEFALHVELRAADLERGGASPAEAWRQARLEFGSADRYAEEGRESRGLRQLDELRGDVRYAVRSLGRTPGFAIAAVLTLALGVGANAAVFSLISATLLRPAPFTDADRLVVLYRTTSDEAGGARPVRWSYPEFAGLREAVAGTAELAVWYGDDVNLSGGGAAPLRVRAEMVSATYHAILGVHPLAGRGFVAADDSVPGRSPVVLLGEGVWRRAFGADPDVIGRTLSLNGIPLTVIGIVPASFPGLSGDAEVWIPQAMAPSVYYAEQLTTSQRFLSVIGRLADGVSVARARTEVAAIGALPADAAGAAGVDARTLSVSLVPLEAARRDPVATRAQFVLAGAALFVLLIAVVNVGGLLLARAAVRAREQAVRSALGAGRFRLLRQGAVEGAVIGAAGAVAGVLLALWSVRTLVALAPERMGGARPRFADLAAFAEPAVDWRVVAFAAALSLLAGSVTGLASVLYGWRSAEPLAALRQARGTGPRLGTLRRPAPLSTAAVVQVAGALVLLVGAGMLLNGFVRLRAVDPGFEPAGVLTFRISPPSSRYGGDDAAPLLQRVLESVETVPGVRYATVSLCPPYSACSSTPLYREGEAAHEEAPIVGRHYVGPDHFRALGIQLVRGRALDSRDRAGARRVAVINETAARQLWPGDDPIGKRVRFGGGGGFAAPDSLTEIVGVVRDVLYGAPGSAVRPDFYTSYLQFTWPHTTVIIRAAGDPVSLVADVRRAVAAVDPELPIYDVRTMQQRSDAALAAERFATRAVIIFAALGTLLALLGVYGIIAYSVAQQRRDIGIRMALGAEASDVLRHVLARGGSLAGAGLVMGSVVAALSVRALPSLMPAAGSPDPRIFIAAAAALYAAALLACLLPAHAATRIDPLETIGSD